MPEPIVVLKFGSSVLTDHDALPSVVLEIYRELRRGRRVLAVVSAFGDQTDRLLAAARERFTEPDPACLARLLETGEAASAATLGLSLDQAGIPARILDAGQIGLTTSDHDLDAEPLDFDLVRLRHELLSVPVVVVPGFSGRRPDGRPALLGRGGSDLVALFLARGLRATECRLLKDVDGLLRVNEDGSLDHGTRYATASYAECLRVGGPLIQPKAVQYAERSGLSFTIARCGSARGTLAGPVASRFEDVAVEPPRIRVALAGLGTVGLGVWRWLRQLPESFEVTGILVDTLDKERPGDVPTDLLTDSVETLLAADPDIVVEAIGGNRTAARLINRAQAAGSTVVCANKQLLAEDPHLLQLATGGGGGLLAAAAVGGSVPVLETLRAITGYEEVIAVKGILNGTCNFVLDRVEHGLSYERALQEARTRGLAEADPYLDTSGLDSVYKLALLAAEAFGRRLPVEEIACEGLDQLTEATLQAARNRDGQLRLVATARRTAEGIAARVGLEVIPAHHPLFDCRGEDNRLVIETEGHRQVVLDGRGAGRWPTTLAVVSDILTAGRAIDTDRADAGLRRARAS